MHLIQWVETTGRLSENSRPIIINALGSDTPAVTAAKFGVCEDLVRKLVRNAKFKHANRHNISEHQRQREVKNMAKVNRIYGRKKKPPVFKVGEDPIHVSIREYLDLVLPKGATPAWHTPNGGKRDKGTASKMKALGVRAGFPDLAFLFESNLYTLEVKNADGTQNDKQEDWQILITDAGGYYAIVRSIDDVKAVLISWGIL